MKKLAIIITHPIQYYVPVFRLLAKQCNVKVFYTWGVGGIGAKYDPGFGKTVVWNLPLLDGYNYELLENIAKDPGSHHGKGIINPGIIAKVEEFAPDAILIYGYIYESHFKVMRYFKGKIPVWFRGDSTLLDNTFGLKTIVKKIYLNWVYSFTTKAFFVGTNNKAYFRKYGLKEEQLIFAPHAVDNQRFGIDRSSEVAALKSELEYITDDLIVLYAGKFEAVKNLNILVEAFNNLRTIPNLKLLLVGNGPDEHQLKAKAQANPNIKFLNFQNQDFLPVIYQLCNVFCLPSISETWGLAINEAMAAGKAVIASDKVGCAADLVQDAVNGFIFSSGDANTLKNKLKILASKPELIKRFGQQSKIIINKWSFEQQVSKFASNF